MDEREKALRKVERATGSRLAASIGWHVAIREARDQGCTLREIARAAGVAHTRVLEIVRERGE